MREYRILLCTLVLLLMTACGAKEQEAAVPVRTETAAEQPVATAEVPAEDLEAESSTAGPDNYVGFYTNGSYDTVEIRKEGEGYSMSVDLYRLTSLNEGTVSTSEEGLVFHTIDAAGNPMTVSFYRNGETYELRIDESTWELLAPGTVISGLVKGSELAIGYPDD